MNVSKLAPYAKAVAAFVAGAAAFAAALSTASADGILSAEETTNIIIALGTWLGGTYAVYQAKNKGL